LQLGTAHRLSNMTHDSLVAGLRTILTPPYVARAREFAARMSKPAESVSAAADQLENFAHLRRVG
jgi:UDP:flavonoid glycosyltransferase YjiC (YdhE family)